MYILAGNSRIDGATVMGETRFYEDLPRPALRVRFDSGLTPEQLADMLGNDWRLMEGEGEAAKELGVQSGYTRLESHEAIFIRMDALEMENNALKEEMAAVAGAIPTLLKGRNDDAIVQFIKYIPAWKEGSYAIGDLRTNPDEYPYRCVQTHDSTGNPSWNTSTASLWAPYHAKSVEYTLPWIAPTGAHDMYKANEYMVFTDSKTYKCLQDTAYSPTDYAQAWQAV